MPSDMGIGTFEGVSESVNAWMRSGISDYADIQNKLNSAPAITTWTEYTNLWRLSKYARNLFEMRWMMSDQTATYNDAPVSGKPLFDARNGKHTYYNCEYTECGFTYLDYLNTDEQDPLWVVFVDFHS